MVRPMPELLDVHRIWDAAPHCAFPDLVVFGGRVLLACREGSEHVSRLGAVRVLTPADGSGASWRSLARLEVADHDLRDPSFSVTPDGRLMLLAGIGWRAADGESTRDGTGTVASFSADGEHWSAPEVVVPPGRWVWRAAWHAGTAFGFAYGGGRGEREGELVVALMCSADGRRWRTHVEELLVEAKPSEVALRFAPDGTAWALGRRDGEPNTALLGRSRAPFLEWEWRALDRHLGGPCFLLPSDGGGALAAGRLLDGDEESTWLLALDLEHATLEPLLELPSGGDTSYPGMLWRDDVLWLGYYSSHEEATSVNLARVRFP